MENIVITFEADASGLEPGIDKLISLGKVDATLANTFNKTNDALKQRQSLVDNNDNALKSYVQNLLQVQKATAGAFGLKGLQDFEKQVNSSSDSMKILQSSIAFAKQNLDKFKPNSPEWQQLNTAIQQGNALLKTYSQTTQTTSGATTNFLTQLRKMRYEMQQLEEDGKGDTQEFVNLGVAAAKLETGIQRTQERIHALASETGNIQALTEGVGALTAGFQVGAGVSALLGANDEDLQKTLIKLNAVMAISSGIQQVQNTLKEQSILKIKLEALAEGVLSTANKITAATYKALGIEVETTSFAFEALRAVTLTLGIGVIVFALTELVSVLSAASNATDALGEAQAKASEGYATEEANLNESIATLKSEVSTRNEKQDAIDKIKASYPEYLGNISQENIFTKQTSDSISKQIDLLQKRALVQASQDLYLDKLKKQAAAQEEYNRVVETGGTKGEQFVATLKDFNNWFRIITPEQTLLAAKTKDLTLATKDADDAFKVVNQSRDKLSAGLQGDVDAFQHYINQFSILAQQFQNISLVPQSKPFDPQAYDDAKKASLTLAQYNLDIATKGTAAEMAAKRALTQEEYNFDLNDLRLTDEQKITSYGKYLSAIADLDKKAREKYLNEQIAADKTVQLKLSLNNQQTSDAYLQAKRKELIDSAALEIAGAADNSNKIKLIHQQLNNDLNQLDIDQANRKLAAQKLVVQDQLDLSKKGSEAEIIAEIGILEIEKQMAINSANGNEQAIQEIKDRYRKEEIDKVKAYWKTVAEISVNSGILSTQNDILKLQLQGYTDTDSAIIADKVKLIDEQAKLAIIEVADDANKVEKIKQIELQAAVDKQAIYDADAQAQIDAQLKAKQAILNIQKSALQYSLDVVGSYGPARAKLDDLITENALENIQAQKDELDEQLKHGKLTKQEYYSEIKDLDDQSLAVQIANMQAKTDREIALEAYASDTIKSLVNELAQNQIQNYQNEQSANQTLLDNKVISQDEYNKRQAKLKKEESATNRNAAIFGVLIDLAKQIFSIEAKAALAAAEAKLLAANPLTALYAPVAFAQSVAIKAEIPQAIEQAGISLALMAAARFRHGGMIDGPGNGTSDSIPIWASKGEYVATAAATKKYEPALRAMNELKFEDYVIKSFDFLQFDFPVMNDLPEWALHQTYSSNIDYEVLAEKVGQYVAKHVGKISDMPQTGFNWTEDGIQKWIKKGQQLDIYLNKKYGYKP